MDHADAMRLKATERYLLNELEKIQLEEFEEHMFDCQECALDVQSASMFLEHTRNILAEPTPQAVLPPAPATTASSWFRWLRPSLAVPAMAVLLLAIGFQGYLLRESNKAASTPNILAATTMNVATRAANTPQI